MLFYLVLNNFHQIYFELIALLLWILLDVEGLLGVEVVEGLIISLDNP